MSQHEQQQIPAAYPPPPVEAHPCYDAAPIGYPTLDANTPNLTPVPASTKTRDDGLWAGCCAALCCCCVLDACF